MRAPEAAVWIVLEILAAFALAELLLVARVPVPIRIVSGVIAGFAAFRIAAAWGRQPEPSAVIRRVGQAFVGLGIGFALPLATFVAGWKSLPLDIALAFATIGACGLIGFDFARRTRGDLMTALMATMPGGIAVMASIAADFKKDVSIVAVMQSLRVTAVVLFVAFAAMHGPGASHAIAQALFMLPPPTLSAYGFLAGTFVALIASIALAGRLGIPAAPFFGALICGLAVRGAGGSFGADLESAAFSGIVSLGQLLLGISIGESLGEQLFISARTLYYGGIAIALTLAVGVGAAAVTHALTDWDWLTCLLATAPGGAPEILAITAAYKESIDRVTLAQIVRQLAVNALMPLWVLLFAYLGRRFAGATIRSATPP